MDTISILIVDDHPLMREALHISLQEEPGLEVIGEASDGLMGVRLFNQFKPDVVLMDLLLPNLDGLGAIRHIIASYPQAKILAFSSLEDEDHILAAVRAGALGYFPKTAPRLYLIEAIRKVADGVPYMPAGIAAKLFKSLRENKAPVQTDDEFETLTPRQQEILQMIGAGRSDAEIAESLTISETTVRTHLHGIMRRLNLRTRAQVVAYVLEQRQKP
jgi:DNA-binding NarL/FixJ family response regulator